MKIQKKRIRNAISYLSGCVAQDKEFRVIFRGGDRFDQKLERIGFKIPISNGDTILPEDVGPITKFNSDGKWDVHKDRPKEERYIRTAMWKWKQWKGRYDYEEKEEARDIYKDCYPRTFVQPPSIELTYVERDGSCFLTSPKQVFDKAKNKELCHVINMFLEIFGECEIVDANFSNLQKVPIMKVNWEILPPGAHPFSTVKKHVAKRIANMGDGDQTIIIDRQKTILGHQPDEQFSGTGGFSDYIAYVFNAHGLVVLESIRKGNAIYVFDKDWKEFSKLTKAQILSADLQVARIIHATGWKHRLAELLTIKSAA